MSHLLPSSPSEPCRLHVSPEQGTVTDLRTGLVWKLPESPDPVSFPSASRACGSRSDLAALGWRLPQIGELVDFLIGADRDGLGLAPATPTAIWSASSAPLAEDDAMRVALWGPDGVRVVTRAPGETALVWHVCRLKAAQPCPNPAEGPATPST